MAGGACTRDWAAAAEDADRPVRKSRHGATFTTIRSMTKTTPISPGLRFLLTAACLVIVVAGLRGASTILVPLALALFVAVISLPLLNFVRNRGVPTSIAILAVVIFDAAALFGFGWLLSLSALEVRNQLPLYMGRLQQLEDESIAWLSSRGLEISASPLADMLQPEQLLDIVSTVLLGATDVLTSVFLVTLIFIFILAEASTFPRKFRAIVGGDEADIGRSFQIVKEIQHYLGIKTVVSAVTGITVGVIMWALGIDFPLLWGLTAFLLNFIPNVGSIVAAIPAVFVALLQIGPGMAMIVMGVYIGVNALYGNFIEPLLVGRQLGLSTLVVVLSLVFWGWVWGPTGMFLSVPLTMALKIILEHSDEFRWVAFLMTSERHEPDADPHVRPAIPPSVGLGRKRTKVPEVG